MRTGPTSSEILPGRCPISWALPITTPPRSGTFTRGTAAVWAWNALGAETKDNGLLVDVLVRGGAIDPAQGADAGILTGKGESP